MGTSSESTGGEPRRAVAVAMIAAVVVFAAGITAAVVLRGPSAPPKPGGFVPTTHAVAAIKPSTADGMAVGNLVLASTSKPLADGGTVVNFLDGVSVTIAPGWTITSSTDTGVLARNGANSAAIWVSSGKPHAPDINGDMSWLITAYIEAVGYTNVVQDPSPDGAQPLQGKNFTQDLIVGYTADQQIDQGTTLFRGTWIDLFNPSTQLDGFIDFRAASPDGLQAAMADVKGMIGSML
jgi:hypothetical protein